MKFIATTITCAFVTVLAACTTASEHVRDVAAGADTRDRVTLGSVQKEIHLGMSSSDVVASLGAPNIVTSDEKRRETWVYDQMATESIYSSSSGGVNALFLAGVGGRSGAGQTSQRTLTIIVKFDEAAEVRDFSYRSSSF